MRASDYKNTPNGKRRARCGACYDEFDPEALVRVMLGNTWVGNVCTSCAPAKRAALSTELAFPYHVNEHQELDTGELALLDDRRASFLKRHQQAAAFELGDAYELPNDES